ncbi:Uncharacterized protein TCM_014382 [Theobroma cacao]|uniref:Uncharacterized protein n=1 Tax=Theobroma cacao TaxID=3641 RepID=A0A061FXE6_THECC|nr:Uncharacterized protein TCM_014382 [Theobroma cacao]
MSRGDSDSDISQSVSEGPTDFTAESRWCPELNNLEGDPFRVPTNWAPSDLGTKVKIRESPSDSETNESVDSNDINEGMRNFLLKGIEKYAKGRKKMRIFGDTYRGRYKV